MTDMSSKYGLNSHAHLTAMATTNVKAGPGILRRITVNTSAAGTITIRDALSDTTPVIAVITTVAPAAGSNYTLEFDVPFTVGLRVALSAVMDVTVVYA